MSPLRQRILEDLQIRNYAPTTVAAYIRGVAEFAKHFNTSPDRLGPEQIREYQVFLIHEKGISWPTYIQPRLSPITLHSRLHSTGRKTVSAGV